MKIDKFKNLKKHLQTQIREADRVGSKWVYILRDEAEKCYILAAAQETLISDPVHPEIEGGGSSWWYVCSECRNQIRQSDRFCRECGRRIQW